MQFMVALLCTGVMMMDAVVDFGNWTMFQKTLERINSSIYLPPIISTNLKYFSLVKKYLKKYKIQDYNIVLEPSKKNKIS